MQEIFQINLRQDEAATKQVEVATIRPQEATLLEEEEAILQRLQVEATTPQHVQVPPHNL